MGQMVLGSRFGTERSNPRRGTFQENECGPVEEAFVKEEFLLYYFLFFLYCYLHQGSSVCLSVSKMTPKVVNES